METVRWLLALALIATACTSDGSSDAASEPDPSGGAPAPTTIRVGTLNIEYGGEVINFDAVVDAALALDADVIGIEEAWGNIPRLAEGMGYPYYDVGHQVVSRLPLLRPPDDDGTYLLVEVGDGVVAIANAHLPSYPSGFNMARNGKSAEQIVATEEQVRVPEVQPIAERLAALADGGIPAFLVGDMNSPSHLDWVEATAADRPFETTVVPWPVTLLLEDEGFGDAYRETHPDPVADPGITWPADRPEAKPGWDPGPNAVHDRIDYVFHAGPAVATSASIVGEAGAADITVDPWPTDHRGLVVDLTVTPGPAPTVISADQRRVEAGTTIGVRWHADGPATIEVRDADGAVAGTLTDGSSDLDTTNLPPGRYELALMADGATLATAPLWIVEPGAEASLEIADDTVAEGEPIDLRWTDAPGNRWDWLGVYGRGGDPTVDSYLVWAYTDATIEGDLTIDEDAEGPWPLPPGEYSIYLVEDDGYDILAQADFTIT